MIFTSFIIAVLAIFCSTFYSFSMEGLNEGLYFQLGQTDSDELFNSTSSQINLVYHSVSQDPQFKSLSALLSFQLFCLAVLQPTQDITASPKASAVSVKSLGYTRGICSSLQSYPAKIWVLYLRYSSKDRVPGET